MPVTFEGGVVSLPLVSNTSGEGPAITVGPELVDPVSAAGIVTW